MDYDALLWYNITHKCVFQGYKAKTLSYVDGKDKKMNDIIRDAILPVRDVPIHIESLRDGCSITLTSTYDEYGPNSNIRNDRLVLDLIEANSAGLSWTMLISSKERDEMRTTHLNALRLFMVKVRGYYHAQLKSQEWEQTLYRMHVKYDDTLKKSTVEWKGNLTHSTKTFDTVILDSCVKEELCADLETFLLSEKWYSSMGLSYKHGYMFHGPPGTGKTSLVLAIANRAKYDIYSLDLSKIRNDTILDEAFDILPEKCIVMFEDIDCMNECVKSRDLRISDLVTKELKKLPANNNDTIIDETGAKADKSYDDKRTVSLNALLNNLDGVANNHGRIFILTTNHPEVLDPALVRYGRVDMSIEVGMCSHEQISNFFYLYYRPLYDDPASTVTKTSVDAQVAELNIRHAEGTFSPAQISSTLQQFKYSPGKAVKKLYGDVERENAKRATI
jgi:hypothetical protein